MKLVEYSFVGDPKTHKIEIYIDKICAKGLTEVCRITRGDIVYKLMTDPDCKLPAFWGIAHIHAITLGKIGSSSVWYDTSEKYNIAMDLLKAGINNKEFPDSF
jgi:hypothetical protein